MWSVDRCTRFAALPIDTTGTRICKRKIHRGRAKSQWNVRPSELRTQRGTQKTGHEWKQKNTPPLFPGNNEFRFGSAKLAAHNESGKLIKRVNRFYPRPIHPPPSFAVPPPRPSQRVLELVKGQQCSRLGEREREGIMRRIKHG